MKTKVNTIGKSWYKKGEAPLICNLSQVGVGDLIEVSSIAKFDDKDVLQSETYVTENDVQIVQSHLNETLLSRQLRLDSMKFTVVESKGVSYPKISGYLRLASSKNLRYE